MNTSDLVHFYVSCPPGLESILAGEYKEIGLTRSKLKSETNVSHKSLPGEETGGMEFEGPIEHVFLANLHLRSASRVIIRLGEFHAAAFSELRKKASRLPWEKYILPGYQVSIKVTCHKSKLYHSDAVAERILGAINDHFSIFSHPGKEVTTSETGQLIVVRLVNDECTISVDSSGELLHKRGYRQAVAKAPLRENLAAAMLLGSAWDKTSPLVDPFCGSGTIPIEAALICNNVAPGIARSFQFQKWPGFNRSVWEEMLLQARNKIKTTDIALYGYDRDTGAIDMAIANAARAGQKGRIIFKSQAISNLKPETNPGWIITNPPYGVRVSENKDLRDLYARFGDILLQDFTGWKVCVLSTEERLLANMNLGNPQREIRFSNGGIPVKYAIYSL